jgi:hypothetical protein
MIDLNSYLTPEVLAQIRHFRREAEARQIGHRVSINAGSNMRIACFGGAFIGSTKTATSSRSGERDRELVTMGRPVFILHIRAEPGGSGEPSVIRRVKAWLKRGLRDYGLRCVSIKQEESEMVDVRKYTSGIITGEDLSDGPRIEVILSAFISDKHQIVVLELESGDQLYCWGNIGRALVKAYGYDTDDWLRHKIKLEQGDTYTDKNGVTRYSINVTPLSSRDGNAGDGPQRVDPSKLPAPVHRHTLKEDLDDEIPFN